MPAIDHCEPQVIRALEKVGWFVKDKPYYLRISEERNIFIDLRLKRHENDDQMIVVEVKCFPKVRAQLDEFYHVLGQYLFYRTVLKLQKLSIPIYLIVPQSVYGELFKRLTVQTTIEDFDVKLVVVDIEKEEIVQWRH